VDSSGERQKRDILWTSVRASFAGLTARGVGFSPAEKIIPPQGRPSSEPDRGLQKQPA